MHQVSAYLVRRDPRGYPALLAETSSPEALALLRSIILEEAEARLQACRDLDDPAILLAEEYEYERQKAVLNALVPPAEELRP